MEDCRDRISLRVMEGSNSHRLIVYSVEGDRVVVGPVGYWGFTLREGKKDHSRYALNRDDISRICPGVRDSSKYKEGHLLEYDAVEAAKLIGERASASAERVRAKKEKSSSGSSAIDADINPEDIDPALMEGED
ncbi:MAG: hypothetical protein ABIG28_01475 [archaeon]